MIPKTKLKNKAKFLEPTVRIGKSGLTQNIITEINKQLKNRKLIKVKFLKSALENTDKKQLAEQILENTDSILIEKVGFVIVLYKK